MPSLIEVLCDADDDAERDDELMEFSIFKEQLHSPGAETFVKNYIMI